MFLFQTGAIKRGKVMWICVDHTDFKFLFQTGAIKSPVSTLNAAPYLKFLFQTGAIKRQTTVKAKS